MTELSEHKIEITIALFLLGGILTWIFIPISVQEDTIIFLTESGGTPTPCSGNLGLILAQNLTDLCDVVIITPINTQVLQYNGSFWVNANVTVTDDTICANVGGGIEVFKNGECNFRTLVGSSDINIIQNTDTIVIDYNGTAGGDTTVCTNVGVGTGLICRGGNVDIKSLIQGSGITITNNANDITITNAGVISCFNVGSGITIENSVGTTCQFDSLIAGTGITITDTTDDLTFASQCANTGTGEAICESSNNINSLIAGDGITITDTTGDLTINATLISQQVIKVFQQRTVTNIGTSYTDVYAIAFDDEASANLFCDTTTLWTEFYIRFQWDHVGTGDQQIRFVDVNNNANILWESAMFSVNQNTASGWIDRPSWCTGGIFDIEMQGKSTVGTDDPIAYSHQVFVR